MSVRATRSLCALFSGGSWMVAVWLRASMAVAGDPEWPAVDGSCEPGTVDWISPQDTGVEEAIEHARQRRQSSATLPDGYLLAYLEGYTFRTVQEGLVRRCVVAARYLSTVRQKTAGYEGFPRLLPLHVTVGFFEQTTGIVHPILEAVITEVTHAIRLAEAVWEQLHAACDRFAAGNQGS